MSKQKPRATVGGRQSAKTTVSKVERKKVKNTITQAVQKTLSTGSAGGYKEKIIGDILMGLACPKGYPVVRWASQFSQKKSAIAHPFFVQNANYGQVGGTYPQLAQAEFVGIIFRNPERNSILYDQNPTGAQKSYAVQMQGGGGAAPSGSASWQLLPDDKRAVITPYAISQNPYAPHGPTLFAGTVRGSAERLLWCDAGDVYSINLQTDTNGAVTVGGDIYTNTGHSVTQQSVIFIAGSPQTLTIKAAGGTLGGYYGLSLLVPTTGMTVTINQLTIVGTGASFGHQPLPNFAANAPSVDGCRVLASSLMFTNTASVLNLGGEIAGYQTAEGDHWMNYPNTNSTFKTVSNLSDAVVMNMSHGMYGFLKPTEVEDFDYQNHLTYNAANVLIDSTYSIDEAGSFLIIVGDCAVAAGCLGYYSVDCGLEYLTDDTWRDTAKADVDYRVYDEAVNRLKYLDQFHENPLHLSDLWSGIKKVATDIGKGIMDYGIPIAKVVKSVASMF